MPMPNLILVLLIGLVLGVIASVILKNRGLTFVLNVLLGVLGGLLGAFAPPMLGSSLGVDVNSPGYLLRALMGSFVLVLVACLFRPARPRGNM